MKRFAAVFATLAGLLSASPAFAQPCVTAPVALPGLPGAPDWTEPGVVRLEQSDPRWLAAPVHGFASDGTGTVGTYRLLIDSENEQLVIEAAASADAQASNADAVYFGFSTDGTSGTLARVIKLSVPTLGDNPRPVKTLTAFTYDAGAVPQWSTSLSVPAWLQEPVAYVGDASAWAIHFKIDLVEAGLAADKSFRWFTAMHVQKESAPEESVNLSTPDPGGAKLVNNTQIIEKPANWSTMAALADGCAHAISLSSEQIGTRAENGVDFDTRTGMTNQLFAKPSIPGDVGLFSGLFTAAFYLTTCGDDAAADAPWHLLGYGIANGSGNDVGSVDFDCPANSELTVCGMPRPSDGTYCLVVGLAEAPGQSVAIEPAVAVRELRLTPMSTAPDAGTDASDASVFSDAAVDQDAGNAPIGDAGHGSSDAGNPDHDAGNPGFDAGEATAHGDAGVAPKASHGSGCSIDERRTAAPTWALLLSIAALIFMRRPRRVRAR